MNVLITLMMLHLALLTTTRPRQACAAPSMRSAVSVGDVATLTRCFETGVDANAPNEKGVTLLMIAGRTAVEWAAVRASLQWAGSESKAIEDAKGEAIIKYLVSKGAVVRELDIVDGVLTFAAMPDLSALIGESEVSR